MIAFFLLMSLICILVYKHKNAETFEVIDSTDTNSIHLVIQLNGNDVTFSWDTEEFYDYFTLHIQPPKVDLNLLTEDNKKKYLHPNKFVKLMNSDKKQIFFKKTIVNTEIDPENTYIVNGFKLNDETGSLSKTTSNTVSNSKIPKIPEENINISFPLCEIDGSYRIVEGDPKNYVQELGPNLDIPSYLDDLTNKLYKDKNKYTVKL